MGENVVVDYVEVFKTEPEAGPGQDEWWWHAKSNNHKIVATGHEPFTSKQHASDAAKGIFGNDVRVVELD